jgi:hypothetical protein
MKIKLDIQIKCNKILRDKIKEKKSTSKGIKTKHK